MAGNIYGTTQVGGAYSCGGDNCGTLFQLVAPVGAGKYQERILWSFYGTNGEFPLATLTLDGAGNLYGTASEGPYRYGIVFEVPQFAVTTTALSSSPNPSTYGQAVTVTGVVTSSAGVPPDRATVSFMKGKTVLGSGSLSDGSAIFTISTLKSGPNSITAVYPGDSTFGSSTSKAVNQVVEKAPTVTALTSWQNPSNFGQSVTFTASVPTWYGSAVAGNVTFKDGTTLLKTVALSGGVAKYTTAKLTEGAHTITATYNGSADFTGSSASLTQTVN